MDWSQTCSSATSWADYKERKNRTTEETSQRSDQTTPVSARKSRSADCSTVVPTPQQLKPGDFEPHLEVLGYVSRSERGHTSAMDSKPQDDSGSKSGDTSGSEQPQPSTSSGFVVRRATFAPASTKKRLNEGVLKKQKDIQSLMTRWPKKIFHLPDHERMTMINQLFGDIADHRGESLMLNIEKVKKRFTIAGDYSVALYADLRAVREEQLMKGRYHTLPAYIRTQRSIDFHLSQSNLTPAERLAEPVPRDWTPSASATPQELETMITRVHTPPNALPSQRSRRHWPSWMQGDITLRFLKEENQLVPVAIMPELPKLWQTELKKHYTRTGKMSVDIYNATNTKAAQTAMHTAACTVTSANADEEGAQAAAVALPLTPGLGQSEDDAPTADDEVPETERLTSTPNTGTRPRRPENLLSLELDDDKQAEPRSTIDLLKERVSRANQQQRVGRERARDKRKMESHTGYTPDQKRLFAGDESSNYGLGRRQASPSLRPDWQHKVGKTHKQRTSTQTSPWVGALTAKDLDCPLEEAQKAEEHESRAIKPAPVAKEERRKNTKAAIPSPSTPSLSLTSRWNVSSV